MSTRNILRNGIVIEHSGQDLHHIIDSVVVADTVVKGDILLADGTNAAAGALADNTARYVVLDEVEAAAGAQAVRAVKLAGGVELAGAELKFSGTALSGAELVTLATSFAVSIA